ncbi:MXAN_2561 family MXYO-CTERM-anchored protein [Archangium lansingense]|uniref:MXAN_2561 family MXYO-CTERM-anchored protein n=1 Tax=Archangium lansingense TaxID=2995310 RepID=UPI00358DC534
MRNLLLTATVLLSSAAFGQTGSLQITVQSVANTDAMSVGPNSCGQTSAFNWQVVGSPCAEIAMWITTDSDCRDSASAQTAGSFYSLPSISLNDIRTSGSSGTKTFEVSRLPIFTSSGSDGGTAVTCSADVEIESTMRLCASTKSYDFYGQCSSTVVKATAPLEISYDTKRPGAPTIESVAALDKALKVTVDAPDDAVQVKVVAMLEGAQVTSKTEGVDRDAVTVENLVNDKTYQLEAYSIDGAGNVSLAFATAEGTPNRTLGFYEKYREAGGEEMGCGATGGGFAGGAILAALGFWLFSRRNRS